MLIQARKFEEWIMIKRCIILFLLTLYALYQDGFTQVSVEIGRIKFEGNYILKDDDLLKLSGIKEGNPFNLRYIEDGIENIIKWYDNNGYPYCRIKLNKVESGKMTDTKSIPVSLEFNVDEGRIVAIDTIIVKGNKLSSRKLIIRESGIKKGEIFSQKKIDEAKVYLSRLPYVKGVSKLELISFGRNKNGVVIDISENPSSRFQGIFGYLPSPGKGKGCFVGSFNINLSNVFGGGRSFSAYWEKKDRNSQDLSLTYSEPWVMDLPLNVSFTVNQIIQDSTFVQRFYSATIGYKINNIFSSYFTIKSEGTFPEDYGKEKFGLYKMQSRFISAGLNYDTRNNVNNPVKGIRYSSSYSIGKRNNIENKKNKPFTDRKVDILMELIIPLNNYNVFFLKGYAKKLRSSEKKIPYSQLLSLGGAKSLRGYKERQFRSSFIGLMTLEYRYIISEYSRFFLFFDIGFFQDENSPDKRLIRRAGYGWGMRINTRLGMIGFDYGLGRDDSFMKGKIHFTLENKF